MGLVRNRALRTLAAAGVAAALVLTGCSASSDSTASTSSDEPIEGGTLRVGLLQDTQSLDPALTTESTAGVVITSVYETLLTMDDDGNLAPGLATEWETSEDGLTVTLTMRDGVTFSDGSPLTADDAAYTLNRIRGLEESPRASLLSTVTDAVAVDDTTLEVTLSEPFAPFLTNLTQFWSSVVSEDAVEENGDLSETMLGSGPFMLDEWDKDSRISLVANPNYWQADEGLPYLDGVEFTFNATSNARIAALESNEIDFLYNVDTTQVETLENEGIYKFYGQGKGSSWMYLLLNQQWGPLADETVRQAIYTAIDRQAVADLCQPGVSTALNAGFAAPGSPYYVDEELYSGDPDEAQALLDSTDYADGFSFTINALTGWDFQICTAEVIQSQLAEIGIDAEIQVMELAEMLDATSNGVENGDFNAQVIAWGGTPDPDQRLSQVFQTGGSANYVGYSNEEVDELLAEARSSSDPDERAELYKQAQLIIAETGPYAFLYTYDVIDVSSDVVEGFEWNPASADNFSSLATTWIAQ